ncbi:CC0125/CC1285 family lipoprotein [Dyella sp. Tek66A03]|uniref:CC0125/CC1285 family lipoprotein n=1 Tax=Dyella sp. Tek66A03 TaxID=3458298 RepID=UPI00403EB6D3
MKTWIERTCVLIVAAAGVTGCATAYQSKSFTGGFSETALSPDTFKISFAGNGFTSAERASDFAILRAADKSLELGCNYFGVMNDAEGASVGSMTVGTAGWSEHSAWGFSNSVPVVKPNSTLLVKCFRDQPPGASLFDAHFIAQSIRAKYGMKSPDGVPSAPQQPGLQLKLTENQGASS